MVSEFPEFSKLDSNDEWVESCGSRSCCHMHNISKNAAMRPWTSMDMNWCDFLDVIDCYHMEREALCGFCKKCKKCRKFKLLCAEAETITLNNWREKDSFVVVVTFNSCNPWYLKTLPMTVDILHRRFINNDEKNYFRKRKRNSF